MHLHSSTQRSSLSTAWHSSSAVTSRVAYWCAASLWPPGLRSQLFPEILGKLAASLNPLLCKSALILPTPRWITARVKGANVFLKHWTLCLLWIPRSINGWLLFLFSPRQSSDYANCASALRPFLPLLFLLRVDPGDPAGGWLRAPTGGPPWEWQEPPVCLAPRARGVASAVRVSRPLRPVRPPVLQPGLNEGF